MNETVYISVRQVLVISIVELVISIVEQLSHTSSTIRCVLLLNRETCISNDGAVPRWHMPNA